MSPMRLCPGITALWRTKALPAPTATGFHGRSAVLHAGADTLPLRFWSIDDPYLYTVEAELFVNGEKTDAQRLDDRASAP